VTRANFVVYLLVVAVFIAGATVRLPGVRKDLEAVDHEMLAALSGRSFQPNGRGGEGSEG